ncbi:lipid II flippase MurJ [Peribacillus frigoritolerans]|uniref:lipid II flippase MurJ n=1 Tax=Peribacillus frigoritolerans TaxID=450367 RepID=UPI003D324E9F
MVTNNKNINIQFLLTIGISILIQIIMLLQNAVAASRYGISGEMDAYNVAYNITTFIFSFYSAAITTILIPSLVKKKLKSVNTFITVLLVIIILSSALLIMFKEQIVKLVGGKELLFPELTSYLLIILTVGYIFKALTGITNAVYQTNNKYVFPKISQSISMILVICIIVFVHNKSIYFFTMAISLGFLIDFLVQTLSMNKSLFIFKPSFDFRDKDFRIMLSGFFPIFISTAFFQISLLIDVFIAGRLGEGNISILTYSNQIVGLVNALIVVNLVAFIYPKMAKLISKDKLLSQEFLLKNIILSAIIMIYIVLEYIVLGKEAITLFFERGMFTNVVTNTVYSLSILYFLTLPFTVIRDLFYRYFYGDNDTTTPLKNSIVVTFIKIGLSLFLTIFIGLYGLVLGTVIANIVSVIMIFFRFKKKYSILFDMKLLLIEYTKILLGGIIAIILTFILKDFIIGLNLYFKMIIVITFSTICYILLCYILKVKVFKFKFF